MGHQTIALFSSVVQSISIRFYSYLQLCITDDFLSIFLEGRFVGQNWRDPRHVVRSCLFTSLWQTTQNEAGPFDLGFG